MSKIPFLTFFLLTRFLTGLAQPKPANAMIDGPYVFYAGDSIIIKNTVEVNGKIMLRRQVFGKNEKQKITLKVNPGIDSSWNFTVSLDDHVTIPACVSNDSDRKILILSDIEGEFKAFRELLLASGVIDKKYQWTFGHGRLIIAGDLFDRGKQVCQFLWLLYKLEQEANQSGGEVHVILGNHDIMNLSGDHAYVQPEYFSDAALMGERYRALYSANTELGRWLRSKNIIEKIGDQLVIHGGISSPVNRLKMSVNQINSKCRPYYEVASKREKILDDTLLRLFAYNTAPFWYRGYFMAPRATLGQVDSTLNFYQCKQIVVGHTILDRNVALYYKGKVLAVDVDEHEGKHQGALYLNGKWYVINGHGQKIKLRYINSNDVIKDQDIR